jgi:hypothetical protein
MRDMATLLRNSLLCVALGVALPAAWASDPPNPSVPQNSTTPPARVLDLKAPDIHQVMSPQAIAAAIPNTDEPDIDQDTVRVHSEIPAPYVPGGFGALYWAVTHPLEAWRILAPVQ